MRILIQRVNQASVTIEGDVKSSIGKGLLILVGIEDSDTDEDIEWLCGNEKSNNVLITYTVSRICDVRILYVYVVLGW